MMPNISKELAGSSPVFLWAAAARCGVTLLQRLITSSREVFVYGENEYLTKQLPAHMIEVSNQAQSELARKRIASGDVNFWSSAALPQIDSYYNMLIENFFAVVRAYHDSSRHDNFQRWGVKSPNPTWNAYLAIHRLLPNSKHVFLYRNLEDVAQSYKARQWLQSPEQIRFLGELWRQNVSNIHQLEKEQGAFVIRYETLLAEPERETERLCHHIGIEKVDMSVFEKKFNTFSGRKEEGHSASQYIEPQQLTAEELRILHGPGNAR